jgi:hypothetical protein
VVTSLGRLRDGLREAVATDLHALSKLSLWLPLVPLPLVPPVVLVAVVVHSPLLAWL